MKKVLLSLIVILFFSLASSFLPLSPDSSFFNTLFTIIGIFYSIGYSIVLGFDCGKIGNKDLAQKLKNNARSVGRSFTTAFLLATALFLLASYLMSKEDLKTVDFWIFKISIPMCVAVATLFIIGYLVFNFMELQKLKDDIDDKIRGEKYLLGEEEK